MHRANEGVVWVKVGRQYESKELALARDLALTKPEERLRRSSVRGAIGVDARVSWRSVPMHWGSDHPHVHDDLG